MSIDYRDYPPQLAQLAPEPFDRKDWLFEIKHDGERVLILRDGPAVELRSRTGRDITAQFPDVLDACRALPLQRYVIDAEVVVFDAQGRASFSLIQQRGAANPSPAILRAYPAVLMAFDLLLMDDTDARTYELRERKIVLRALLKSAPAALRYVEHIEGKGRELYATAEQNGLEGVMAKRASSRYTGKRSAEWLKFKCRQRGVFTVIGWTAPQNSRQYFGALALAERDAQGQLRYVGKCGTGYKDGDLAAIWPLLKPVGAAPCATSDRAINYCAPGLAIECEFLDRTTSGQLRHASFKGLRPALTLVKPC